MIIDRTTPESVIQDRIDKFKFYHGHEPNWTPHPRWIDVFKGADDERVLFKTLLMTKYTAGVGACFSVLDIMLTTQAQTIAVALHRLALWNIPIIGGGLAYTTTVALASTIRGKKNAVGNHFLGGLAAGAMMGMARKSFIFGMVTGFMAGIYGGLHKDMVLQGFEVWSDVSKRKTKFGHSMSHKTDYSTKPDRPGFWVRSEEDQKKYMNENFPQDRWANSGDGWKGGAGGPGGNC